MWGLVIVSAVVACRPNTIQLQFGYEHAPRTLNRHECMEGPKWHNARPPMALGLYYEDAVIFERFFKSGPLAYIQTRGTFVDVGVRDGLTFSNTFLLEHCLHWNGIIIEPNSSYLTQLLNNRPCSLIYCGDVCPRQPTRTCQPMTNILRRASILHVHFMSICGDGTQLDILKSIDWSLVSIDVLLIDTHTHAFDIHAWLVHQGMRRVPSQVECNLTAYTPCHRNAELINPIFLSVQHKSIYVGSQELYDYDMQPYLWDDPLELTTADVDQ